MCNAQTNISLDIAIACKQIFWDFLFDNYIYI